MKKATAPKPAAKRKVVSKTPRTRSAPKQVTDARSLSGVTIENCEVVNQAAPVSDAAALALCELAKASSSHAEASAAHALASASHAEAMQAIAIALKGTSGNMGAAFHISECTATQGSTDPM